MWTVQPGDGDRPTPEQIARFRRRHGPPGNEVPTRVVVPPLVARSATAAVAVQGAQVFSTGVSFDLLARVRTVPSGARMHEMFRAMRMPGEDHAGGPDLRVLLGIEFADGRRGDNLTGFPVGLTEDDSDPERPRLVLNGGSNSSGTSFRLDGSLWLTPVPPDGPVTLVAAWPAFDVAETRLQLPPTAWSSVAADVVVLWPEPDDPRPSARPAPPPPDVAPDSWFATGR